MLASKCSATILLLLIQIFVVIIQQKWVSCICTPTEPCYPSPTDLARVNTALVSTNSTCGSPAEEFCVELNCTFMCNASNPAENHPKEYLYDSYDLPTFWKSKNFEEPVSIQLDLGQRIILHQIIVTFQYELPEGVYFERSQDNGKQFQILAYYARECLRTFNRQESVSGQYDGTNVLCFRIDPEVSTNEIVYAPRRDDKIAREVLSGGAVRDHFITTNVRVILHQFYKPADFNRNTADQRRFYFALRDLDIQGSCFCNGMADSCNTEAYGKCNCQKNTAGDHCERCLPLYNNKAWEFGKACEVCNCNNHSVSCTYSTAKQRGVCNNCSHNTGGDQCENCQPGYFRNSSLAINDPLTCVSCGCNLAGASGVLGICNAITSFCFCKTNVMGEKCNMCKDQYYGLAAAEPLGCKDCSCFPNGTVGKSNSCNKLTGQCPCINGYTGRTCSTCQDGFVGNTILNPTVCTPCYCDPSGSINSSCLANGDCFCKPNFLGQKCQLAVTGYFAGSIQQFITSAWSAVVSSNVTYRSNYTFLTNAAGQRIAYYGYLLRLDTTGQTATSVSFSIKIEVTTVYEMILRYLTSYTFTNVTMVIIRQSSFQPYSCQAGTSRISVTQNTQVRFQSHLMPTNQSASFGRVCLSSGDYRVIVSFDYTSGGTHSSLADILVTSLLTMPFYAYSNYYVTGNATLQSQIQYFYTLGWSQASWSFYRQQGAKYLAFVFGPLFPAALPCLCNQVGSVATLSCRFYGGQCQCQPNVVERRCLRCLPTFFNFTSGRGCSACDCHALGSTNTSCDSISGQCQCRTNVVRRRCDQCIPNYYGVSSATGCKPCSCSTQYSATSQCLDNGTCMCKPGIGGEKCSQCKTGYFRISNAGCEDCRCNAVGRLDNTCNNVTGVCTCKENVRGPRCSLCKIGFFGFSSLFPNACLRCQCSGKTNECTHSTGYSVANISTVFGTSENNVNVQGWTAVNQIGRGVGTIRWEWEPRYSLTRGYARLVDTSGTNSELFFSAPSRFLGNKRNSYMLMLMFELTQQDDSRPIQSAVGDVILKSSATSYTLVTSLPLRPSVNPRFRSYKVQLYEIFWRKNQTNGPIPTDNEMVEVLSTLSAIWIRARWSQVSRQFSGLANVYLQYSSVNGSGLEVRNVERCFCPRLYTGQFCEVCAEGYTRVIPRGSPSLGCVLCQCNGHSTTCDPHTGVCSNCQHSTTGDHCEQCAAGYYGNATRGTSQDCSPCRCPGGPSAPNQFSKVCVLESDGRANCTQCQTGYQGRNCERCADGYFGTPVLTTGRCRPCNCNNNVNPTALGNCNSISGECLKCLYNTTGFSCQWCKERFYGNALTKSCRDCRCNTFGSINNLCNNMTGQCSCRTNVIGLFCDRCANNTYNLNSGSGCQLCNCNTAGSISLQCGQTTGKCQCKTNVLGDKCDQCAPGFYDVSKGCLPCNCNATFTVANTSCDGKTGQCVCMQSLRGGPYGGRTCNQCGPNAIGSPPDCALCHYPCYDNWQQYVAREEKFLQDLTRNSSDLLAQFKGLTYQDVLLQIDHMNGNLTYAGNIFQGAQFDSNRKETQFKQIETVIIQYEASLNRSESILKTAQEYFGSTASSFNGTIPIGMIPNSPLPYPFAIVRVRRAITPVTGDISPERLTTLATEYVQTSQTNNASGYILYSTITQSYNQILTVNKSISDAASNVTVAMTRLVQAAQARSTTNNYLDQAFQNQVQANAADLNRINTLLVSLETFLNQSERTQATARRSVDSAQSVIAEAETKANLLKTSATSNSRIASQMYISAAALKTDAEAKQAAATNLKSNTDTVQYDANLANRAGIDSINRAAAVRNRTSLTSETAQRVINTSIPVSLGRIQTLSNQIVATNVDEAQINQTFAGAENGLKKAQDVQRLSKQAVDISQSTLDDIRLIESNLLNTTRLQNETKSLIIENDRKIAEVLNISSTVEQQIMNLRTEATLTLINANIKAVDDNMMCFVDAKERIDNATVIAQAAQNFSTEAVRDLVRNQMTQFCPVIPIMTSIIMGEN